MNQDGAEFLGCRWPAEAALDVLAVFGLRARGFRYFGSALGALITPWSRGAFCGGRGSKRTRVARCSSGVTFAVDPVREFGQRPIDAPPKGDAIGNRRRCGNRAEAGDDLVADFAIDAAGHQAALHPSSSLAKAGDHGSRHNMIAITGRAPFGNQS
jgi:hypothetical protein